MGESSHQIAVTAWKVSKYGIFSGPYFPIFGLNTGKYGPVGHFSHREYFQLTEWKHIQNSVKHLKMESLCKKCPNMKFFCSVFFLFLTDYGKIRVRKISAFGHFLQSGIFCNLFIIYCTTFYLRCLTGIWIFLCHLFMAVTKIQLHDGIKH